MSIPPVIREAGTRPTPLPEHRALLQDMRSALLSEIGARTIYARLATRGIREDLRLLLERFEQESEQILERLGALMSDMGGVLPHTSLRRRLLAAALARLAPVIGIRPILRLCQHAEETVSRWYASYSAFLAEIGDEDRSRTCQELSVAKLLHAQALSAWLSNLRRLD